MSISRTLEHEAYLDQSWVHLMIAARKIGISAEEIRDFLQQTSADEENDDE